MRFDILTLFPQIFDGFLGESLLRKALDCGRIEIHRWNLRDWTTDKHRKVDDRPYGGGPGMVISPQPVFDAVEAVQAMAQPAGRLVLLTPRGERFDQGRAEELALERRLLLLCGRYEGFDERVIDGLGPLEVSIGDYVLNGGEIPAMVLVEAIARLLPGFLGHQDSAKDESFREPGWLEYPQYTRPPEFRGLKVPDVLIGGNHAEIARWREEQARERSRRHRGETETP